MKMNTAIVAAATELRNQVMNDAVAQLVTECRAGVRAIARFKFNVGATEYAVPNAQGYVDLLIKNRAAYAKAFNALQIQPSEIGTLVAGVKKYAIEWSPTNKTRSWAVANAVTLVETTVVAKVPKAPKEQKATTEPKQPTTPKQPRVPKDKTPKDKTATKTDPQVLG